MASYEYTVVSDNPKDGEYYACGWLMSGCVMVVAVIPLFCFILSLVLGWTILSWISAVMLVVLLTAAFLFRFNYDKTSPRLRKAERVKEFLGFDFGNDFTLKAVELREVYELMVLFDEASFAPLLDFCKSQAESSERVDNKGEIVITEIKQHSQYFTKTESHRDFRICCVVEYENCTLCFSILSWA